MHGALWLAQQWLVQLGWACTCGGVSKQKMIVIEQLAVSNSTILNQEFELDWNKEAELI